MKILVGDILESQVQTLVNTVNCVGVMGKGIALEFKKRFPDMYSDYLQKCERKTVHPGIPYIYERLIDPQIVNFPTKGHWKSVSKLADIERGMKRLVGHYKAWGITSIAIPPLGCGNGQLEWGAVGPIIYKYGSQMKIPIELYAPYGTPAEQLTDEFLRRAGPKNDCASKELPKEKLKPGWVALVEILNRIEQEPYHWPVGRTTFQKIAYIATREGFSTDFVYRKGSFGPYSKDLKKAFAQLVNSNLLQEERMGRMFRVKVGPNYARVRKSFMRYLSQPEWANWLDRITDLFLRVNTEQAELLTTVMYAADELERKLGKKATETIVLDHVLQWKLKRRAPLEPATVGSTIRNLAVLGWLQVEHDANLPISEEDFVLALEKDAVPCS